MPIKCRQECQSDCSEYKSVSNTVNFAIKQLKSRRKQKGVTSSRKMGITNKIHTLMVAKWLGAQRFNVQSVSLSAELKSYHRAAHTSIVDELFLRKHYRYDDIYKYEQQFKEDLNYEMEII